MELPALDTHTAITRLRSFGWLFSMQPSQVDAFLRSYVLFEGDWSQPNGKRESHIVDYYRVINHLCALGNVEKMYFPPLLDERVGVKGNQLLFERQMMEQIGARPGSRVLDLGCGRGRVALHVAERTGAHVTGLNIEPSQLENARGFARSRRLADRTTFVLGSLNDPLPFPDESFDGAYEIQAFTYARDKTAVFRELFRVLRPGSRFSYLDWVRLPGFDVSNPEHVEIMRGTAAVIGAVDTPSPEEVEVAMREVGFQVTHSGDPSIGGHQSPMIERERKYFSLIRRTVRVAVKSGLFPKHLVFLFERLKQGSAAFVQADQRGLATTSYQIVCRKPD